MVAVRSLGREVRDWQTGAWTRPDGTPDTALGLCARIGPLLLAAHGVAARTAAGDADDESPRPSRDPLPALAPALAELIGSVEGDARALRALQGVLGALESDRAIEYLRGVVGGELGDSVKLQHDDALAGSIASLLRRGDRDAVGEVIDSRLAECVALARDVYGTVFGAPLFVLARSTAIEAFAEVLLDERVAPALGIDDAVYSLVNGPLVDDHRRGDALTRREIAAVVRWADWCDGVARRALLPQSFGEDRWHGAELRSLATALTHSLLSFMVREERYEEALALLDDAPAPIDARHERLTRVLAAIPAPGAVALAVPRVAERSRLAAAIEPHIAEIEALHEPECKRLDRPGVPYDVWIFEQTALLLGVHALCIGQPAKAYDHADELAWARNDRDVPIGVMYMLALAGIEEADALTLPEPDFPLDDPARPGTTRALDDAPDDHDDDQPRGRTVGLAADLLAALDHGYEPDLDELATLLERLGIDVAVSLVAPDSASSHATAAVDDARERPRTWAEQCARLCAHLVRLRAEATATELEREERERVDALDPTEDVTVDDEPEPWSDARAEDLVQRLLDGEAHSDANDADLLGALADHLASATVHDLDERWLAALDEGGAARRGLGDDAADVERVRVLARVGRVSAARAVATGLFWRAVNGTTGPAFAAPDLADLVEELGAPDAELADMRAAMAREHTARDPLGGEPAIAIGARPVRVVFVGGNEIQAQYVAEIERALPDHISVDWFMTGWSARWGPEAERIEAAYERADAVVLMQFTRTQLGRRLRRSSGEAGLPWIPCTGHGRDSLRRAILRAAAVVEERRTPPTGKTPPL